MTRAAIGMMAALCLYAEEKENPETGHGRTCNYGTGELRLCPWRKYAEFADSRYWKISLRRILRLLPGYYFGWTLLIAYDTVKVAYVCTEHTVIRVPDKTAFANGAQGVRAGRRIFDADRREIVLCCVGDATVAVPDVTRQLAEKPYTRNGKLTARVLGPCNYRNKEIEKWKHC